MGGLFVGGKWVQGGRSSFGKTGGSLSGDRRTGDRLPIQAPEKLHTTLLANIQPNIKNRRTTHNPRAYQGGCFFQKPGLMMFDAPHIKSKAAKQRISKGDQNKDHPGVTKGWRTLRKSGCPACHMHSLHGWDEQSHPTCDS